VRRIEYDPNRSARIALVDYEGDVKATHYIIAPEGMKVTSDDLLLILLNVRSFTGCSWEPMQASS
jgi:ribosomal protein L2